MNHALLYNGNFIEWKCNRKKYIIWMQRIDYSKYVLQQTYHFWLNFALLRFPQEQSLAVTVPQVSITLVLMQEAILPAWYFCRLFDRGIIKEGTNTIVQFWQLSHYSHSCVIHNLVSSLGNAVTNFCTASFHKPEPEDDNIKGWRISISQASWEILLWENTTGSLT